MAKHQIIEYTIWLRDAAKVLQVQEWIAAFGVGGTATIPGQLITQTNGVSLGIYKSPVEAGIDYGAYMGGAPLPIVEGKAPVPGGGLGYLTSGWFTPNNFPRDERTFDIEEGWWIFGKKTKFYWAGKVALAPGVPITTEETPGVPANELPGATFAQRYWLKNASQLRIGGESNLHRTTPAASRTGDGWGWRAISTNQYGAQRQDIYFAKLTPPLTNVHELWQRFYVRPLRFGSATGRFWLTDDTWGEGFSLGLTTSGAFALYRTNASSLSLTLLMTFGQAVLNRWHRVDVFIHTVLPVPPATDIGGGIEVRIDGLLGGQGGFVGNALSVREWVRAELGPGVMSSYSDPATDLEVDLDDWIGGLPSITQNSTVPEWVAVATYTIGAFVRHSGLTYQAKVASLNVVPSAATAATWTLVADGSDLTLGSHLVRVTADTFGPNHDPSWVGDVRTVAQRMVNQGSGTVATLTSATPGILAEVNLPVAAVIDTQPQALGIVAWRVIVYAPGLSYSLGYQVGDAAPVMQALDPGTGEQEYFTLTGTAPAGVALHGETLTARYLKGPTAPDEGPVTMSALLELQGTFGPEDVLPGTPPPVFPAPTPVHLNLHPGTPWARDANPLGPLIRVGGTYVGTGQAGQDLLFPLPVAFLLIRRVTNQETTRWWPSMLLPGNTSMSGTLSLNPLLTHQDQDPDFVPAGPDADQQLQFRVRITAGAVSFNQTINALGETFQYVALLDPAGRFSRAFATAVRPVGADAIPGVPRTWPLDDLTFTPECSLQVGESSITPVDPGFTWKGPGHAADAVSEVQESGALTIPDALSWATGAVTLRAGLVVGDAVTNFAFLFFRRDDGNGPNQPVVFFGTYTGDAAASRTLTFGSTGHRPLYAMVGAGNGTTYHRDPSYTGVTSTAATGSPSVSSTAIMAGGLDSFTVGSALNATGVTYHFWGIYGGTEAGNNGWSPNGTFVLPPDSTKPPGWVEPVPGPEEPVDPDPDPDPDPGDPDPDPTDPGDPGSDIGVACVKASTRIVNLALQEIGITKEIVSLGATTDDPPKWIDTSQEAYAARMIYRTLVDTVLRDDEWAFTREYATLTAYQGTTAVPVNPDWTYSYKLPVDCLRVKRICEPTQQRRYSVTPVPFDRRADDLGQVDLLLTNEPGVQLPAPAPGAPIQVTIEYAKRIACPARVTDAQFRQCLVFRLAAGLAKALARDSADSDRCLRNYALALPKGLTQHANDNEPQPPTGGLPDWMKAR